MNIRPVRPEDALSTTELLNDIIATGVETSMADALTLEEQKLYITSFPSRGIFLVAELPSPHGIVGMQSIEPFGEAGAPSGHVGEISTFVAASFQAYKACLRGQLRLNVGRRKPTNMAAVFLHFIAGTLGALVVFLVFLRLSGATSFSAPFGAIFIGIACAALSHFLSPWATPAIIIIYAVASAGEYRRA